MAAAGGDLLLLIVVTPVQAVAACVAMTVTFVASLYLLPRHIRTLPRDDRVHIRARFLSVVVSCCAAVRLFMHFTTPLSSSPASSATGRPLMQWLGLWDWGLWGGSVWLPLANVMCLFAGPTIASIAEMYVDCLYRARYGTLVVEKRPQPVPWGEAVRCRVLLPLSSSPEAMVRNLIMGPASEELVFRSCMLPLLMGAGWSRGYVLWCSPLFFGLAHLHHAIQRIREGMPVVQSVAVAVLQLSYTTMFGWYAAFLFLRTALVWPCILVHSYCNFMGLPSLAFLSPPPPDAPASAVVLHRPWWRWSLLLGAYGGGIALFAATLLPATHTALHAQQPHPVFWEGAATRP